MQPQWWVSIVGMSACFKNTYCSTSSAVSSPPRFLIYVLSKRELFLLVFAFILVENAAVLRTAFCTAVHLVLCSSYQRLRNQDTLWSVHLWDGEFFRLWVINY